MVLLLIGPLTAQSEVLMWSNEARDAYRQLDHRAWYSRSRFQEDIWGNYNEFNRKINLVALKNSSRVRKTLSDFTVRRVKGKANNNRKVKVSTIGNESCQCVALVKHFTDSEFVPTSRWREGASLRDIGARNLNVGTAIAIFDANGNYSHIHTAIVVGKSGRGDWIEVLDQNWNPIVDNDFAQREERIGAFSPSCTINRFTIFKNAEAKGFVMRHRIYFDDSLSAIYNANSYSIVEL